MHLTPQGRITTRRKALQPQRLAEPTPPAGQPNKHRPQRIAARLEVSGTSKVGLNQQTTIKETIMELEIGTVVRDRIWGGRCTGTIVRREGQSVSIAWHNSCVEDDLDIDQVEIWPDAPPELAAWQGALGCLNTEEEFKITPITQSEK
jgi:hypothetical protein